MPGLFRVVNTPQLAEPDRPTHFREDQNQRDILPEQDYATQHVDEPHGFLPAANPVPVYMVEPPPADMTLRDWTGNTTTLAAAGQGIRILGPDRRRTRFKITNLDGANTVIVSKGQSSVDTVGFTLAAGKTEEFFHNSDVWVRSTAGAAISWFEEHQVEEI